MISHFILHKRTLRLIVTGLVTILTACQVHQQTDNGSPPTVSILVQQDGESKLIATTGSATTVTGCAPPTYLSPTLESWEASTYHLMFPGLNNDPFLYGSSQPPFRFTVSAHDPDGLNNLYITLGDSDGPPAEVGGDIEISDVSPSWVDVELQEPSFDSIYRWWLRSPGSLAFQRTALQFSFTIDKLTVSNRLLVVALDSNGDLRQTMARLLPGASACLKP